MIKVVTDSTCYLPQAFLSEYDIRVVPLNLLFGTTAYSEGIEIDTEQFFRELARVSFFPTTSQPSPEAFVGAWQPLLDAGHEIVTILLSTRLSSTVNAAYGALQMLPQGAPITIVDSLSIAMGLGMQVLRAAEMARERVECSTIVSVVERMRDAVQIVLVPDTLEYLYRGGRINTAQAWMGTLLRVKPLLALCDGIVEPLEKVRTAKRAFSRMVEHTVEHLGNDRAPWIAVMHSRTPDVAHELLTALKALYPQGRFFCAEIGPVLGAHLGPGGSGVISCPSMAL